MKETCYSVETGCKLRSQICAVNQSFFTGESKKRREEEWKQVNAGLLVLLPWFVIRYFEVFIWLLLIYLFFLLFWCNSKWLSTRWVTAGRANLIMFLYKLWNGRGTLTHTHTKTHTVNYYLHLLFTMAFLNTYFASLKDVWSLHTYISQALALLNRATHAATHTHTHTHTQFPVYATLTRRQLLCW